MNGLKYGKQFSHFIRFVEEIKDKSKRCIIFGPDYVVLSRNVYDKMIKELYPEKYSFLEFNESETNNWIKNRFLSEK